MVEPQPGKPHNLLLNSIFGVLAWLSPIILGFISTPILIKGLGAEAYGVYALILGFLGYSFTFGIGRVAAKYVAEYSAVGDKESVSRSVSAALIFSLIIGIGGAGLLALITPFIVQQVLLLPPAFHETAETGLYIASVTGLMIMITQVFQYTLQGVHRFGTYLLISNISAVLLSGGTIGLALAGYGIPGLLSWHLFTVITSGILFYVSAIAALPTFRPTLSIGWEMARSVAHYGANIIIFQVFANLLLLFERTWIVRNFGADAVTFYVVPMMLGIYMHGLVSSFAQVIFPSINELLDDRKKMLLLYMKANRLVAMIVLAILTTYIFSGENFLGLWVGEEFVASSYRLLVIHGATFGILGTMIVIMSIFEAYRAPSINALLTLFLLIFGVIGMIVFGGSYGPTGVGIGRLVAVIMALPFMYLLEKRFLGKSMHGFWLSTLFRLLPAAFLMGLIQFVLNSLIPRNWLGFLFAVAISSITFFLVLYVLRFFANDEIERLTHFLRLRR